MLAHNVHITSIMSRRITIPTELKPADYKQGTNDKVLRIPIEKHFADEEEKESFKIPK